MSEEKKYQNKGERPAEEKAHAGEERPAEEKAHAGEERPAEKKEHAVEERPAEKKDHAAAEKPETEKYYDEGAESGEEELQGGERSSEEDMSYDEELLDRIENAAARGAQIGSRYAILLSTMITLLLIVAAVFILPVFFGIDKKVSDVPSGAEISPTPEEKHITTSDFAEAILTRTEQKKKVEVFEAEISDVVKLSDEGLLNLSVFSKSQLITFNGYVVYTVDLTEMSELDIELDESAKKVTLWIPHAEQGEIRIPASEMEFGDVEKGFLAFGDLKLSGEDEAKVEMEAEKKMEETLLKEQTILQADRFAKLTVWEIFQPFVAKVSPEYTFEVSFK